jgi:hypothetical protein
MMNKCLLAPNTVPRVTCERAFWVSSVLVQPDGRGPHSVQGNRTNACRRFGVARSPAREENEQ